MVAGKRMFRDYKGKLRPFEEHGEGIWMNDVQVFEEPPHDKIEGVKPLELMEMLLHMQVLLVIVVILESRRLLRLKTKSL